jgi:hypothetical protein
VRSGDTSRTLPIDFFRMAKLPEFSPKTSQIFTNI